MGRRVLQVVLLFVSGIIVAALVAVAPVTLILLAQAGDQPRSCGGG